MLPLSGAKNNLCLDCPKQSVCGFSSFLSQGHPDESSRFISVRRYRASQYVAREGEPATALHLVCRGAVLVTAIDESGMEAGLHLVGVGEFLNATDLFLEHKTYSRSAECLGDAAVAAVSGEALHDRMQNSPALAASLLRQVASQMRLLEERHRQFQCRDTSARTIQALLQMVDMCATRGTKNVLLPFRLKRSVLARLVGASRETVSRVFADLLAHGLIHQSDHRLMIPDPARLEEAARSSPN
jgi:CRP/FNR family transcriptional regulator